MKSSAPSPSVKHSTRHRSSEIETGPWPTVSATTTILNPRPKDSTSIGDLAPSPTGLFSSGLQRLSGAAFMAVVCGVGFTTIGVFNRHRFGVMPLPIVHRLSLDNAIPFLPAWVWVYLMYYPFCFLPLLLSEVRGRQEIFSRTLVGFAIQFLVSFTIFLVLPLRMIHPILPPGLDGEILGGLYGFDLGFNSFPSLHLANIVFVTLLFWKLHRGRSQAYAVVLVATLIACSTMFVKQHFISDVLSGALLGWFSFAFAFHVRLLPFPERSSL